MTRATPASHILMAAIIAIISGLLAGVIVDFANTLVISLVSMFAFVSGILTPWLSATMTASRAAKAKRPRSVKESSSSAVNNGQNPDDGEQMTLYVGNLPFKTSEENVEDTFAQYGEVFAVRLVKDRRTGKRKGYGFVEMEPVGAELALNKLNDSDFEGRTLKVRFANTEKKE